MANEGCFIRLVILVLFHICFLGSYSVDAEESSRSTYIVHVRLPSGNDLDLNTWYESLLPNADGSPIQGQRIIHRYRHAATGFAAKLTQEEVKALREKDDVLHVMQEKVYLPHTTLTPKFLGLNQGLGLWNGSSSGKGVIIGVLDTGITPGHPSFGDEGMDPPPAKWKGRCEFKVGCNNKLIGSRNFVSSDPSAVDDVGHGTHTSSTAAGHVVEGANALGMANGTASGIAPLAHVAMYKVCMESGCPDSSILAGIDAAIEDGVDVLSISLGAGSVPFSIDNIAIGTFSAIQKGIFVSCSAGNDGPEDSTLSNEAPWILTVGASTIDRSIRATASLGNGQEFDGESLYQPTDFPPTLLPLVYPGAISGRLSSAQCLEGSLNATMVKGKVVVCDIGGGRGRVAKGQEVKNAGGAAMILINEKTEGYTTLVDDHVLPAAHVNYAAAVAIKAYLNSTSNATATILFKGTIIGNSTAPVVSFFSSRGPSQASPGILKPDIIGPGVSILAAWPEVLDNSTSTKSTFYVASGTSMSCPHLSGVAALIKSSHPNWSVAAIKSAIMTSADITTLIGTPSKIPDQTMGIADYYTIGSGHVNPSRANNPGLVFDIEPTDYIPYLCGLNYSDSEIEVITKSKVQCATIKPITESELNYPSMTVNLGSSPVTYSRVVKNVDPAESRYTSVIINPEAVDISVGPGDLKFSEAGETITYYVTFTRNQAWNNTMKSSQGYLNWVSPTHTVRTPLLLIFQ